MAVALIVRITGGPLSLTMASSSDGETNVFRPTASNNEVEGEETTPTGSVQSSIETASIST